MSDEYRKILSDKTLIFLEKLSDDFHERIEKLLSGRRSRKNKQLLSPKFLFNAKTNKIRYDNWEAAPIPDEIKDRRVEITGPPVRKMVINALNSGANVFMADFEDSNAPTWENCLDGQINLRDAVNRTIEFTNDKGKHYKLNSNPAVLFVRPRGLHMSESHVLYKSQDMSASLFDFGIYVSTNHKQLQMNGSRPYFYLPKIEHFDEAMLWDDIFCETEDYFKLERGTIKATVLIETLPAAFQMNEIIYALKTHSAGLNCGRWDYIFSFIKFFRNDKYNIFPDRDQVGMTQHFMRSYTQLLVKTCHRRGVHAMGGMAAQIPIKHYYEANADAMNKVKSDKLREVLDGHDGTWVAHPGLIHVAKNIFDDHMPEANQIDKEIILNREVLASDLLSVPVGTCTYEGLVKNITVFYKYLDSWLGGNGCVPINNLMEDAATAEISRVQIWQWQQNKVKLTNGDVVSKGYLKELIYNVLGNHKETKAFDILLDLCLEETLTDFLTLKAYEEII
jgi:malate synthase